MFGTMVLVLMGCGTAVSLNCGVDTAAVVGTAMAFGLSVVAMAYAIGGISGCHINSAITLGCLLSKRISGKDAAMYMIFQVIGAFIGSAVLYALVATSPELAAGTTTGANACAGSVANGLIAEIVLTAVFEGGVALQQLWVFIVGPFVGAVIAAIIWKLIDTNKE